MKTSDEVDNKAEIDLIALAILNAIPKGVKLSNLIIALARVMAVVTKDLNPEDIEDNSEE